jgi:FtsP/CotA-like multicopper oxidase with cupredoxin domain
MSSFTQLFVVIEDHLAIIVEVDGVLTAASKATEGFLLAPGQRVSVIVENKASQRGYRIVTEPVSLKS